MVLYFEGPYVYHFSKVQVQNEKDVIKRTDFQQPSVKDLPTHARVHLVY